MAEEKIRLTRPYLPETVISKLQEILQSGYWTQGEQVDRFERMLAEYLGIDHVVLVSSGTAALHLALLALDIGPGDEVIIPAFSFAATANVVKLCGARPLFVDIKLDDYCLNTGLLERIVTPETKAIMPVHEFGAVADMEMIQTVARKYDLHIIEDSACALGSEYRGKKAGTMGDSGSFSFHPRKILTTGEGGAIVTNDPAYAEKFRMLRNHGTAGGVTNEGFKLAGLNYRMTDFQALLGIAQIGLIEETIRIREEQAEFYNEYLENIPFLSLSKCEIMTRHTYQSYHLLVNNHSRDVLIKFLASNNIESNIGAQFLPGLSSMKEYRFDPNGYPEALRANTAGLVLPIGRHLNKSSLERIVSALKEFDNDPR